MASVLVTTWYLEMTARRERSSAPPEGMAIERLERPSAALYRSLYEVVGGPWRWVDRLSLSGDALEAIVQHPEVEVHRLVGVVPDGEVRGYFELDRRVEGACELAYFGLAPSFIGRGLGRWFLDEAIQRAWAGSPERVFVHTCSLDHPRALSNYERAGFRVYDEATALMDTGSA